MGKADLPKLILFGDPKKGKVADALEDFSEFAAGKADVLGKCYIDECREDILNDSDFAVVFGGDGSIISAARTLSRSNVPVIGVNMGKLGYLAEFSMDEIKQYFGEIVAARAKIEKRMVLGCRILKNGKEIFKSSAINEVFITAGPPFRMIELRLSVNDQPLAGCVSDGLIMCTPTGSTAYNLSAGGPILSGKMEAMVITFLSPHSLNFRPIVIKGDSRVNVYGIKLNEGTTLSVDGQVHHRLSCDETVEVEREKSHFLVVNNPIRTQWDTLATKLSWAEKPRYKRDDLNK